MKSTLWLILAMLAGLAAPAAAQGRGNSGIRLAALDRDGDGSISRDEWRDAFDWLDANHDGRLSATELREAAQPRAVAPGSPAYAAGYDRGRQEGIQAGREDKPRGWDLEGQRELETADSGWEPKFGNRAEYQGGYRAGFRRGYAEGFGPRYPD